MSCRYCPTHQRGLIPEGYDLRQRQTVPARWHTLTPATVALAQAWGKAYGCAGEIVVELTTCDVCITKPGV